MPGLVINIDTELPTQYTGGEITENEYEKLVETEYIQYNGKKYRKLYDRDNLAHFFTVAGNAAPFSGSPYELLAYINAPTFDDAGELTTYFAVVVWVQDDEDGNPHYYVVTDAL